MLSKKLILKVFESLRHICSSKVSFGVKQDDRPLSECCRTSKVMSEELNINHPVIDIRTSGTSHERQQEEFLVAKFLTCLDPMYYDLN